MLLSFIRIRFLAILRVISCYSCYSFLISNNPPQICDMVTGTTTLLEPSLWVRLFCFDDWTQMLLYDLQKDLRNQGYCTVVATVHCIAFLSEMNTDLLQSFGHLLLSQIFWQITVIDLLGCSQYQLPCSLVSVSAQIQLP